ncbi:signal peptidase II [Candidatus Peregrinibacteria bacterium]|nr:signal peptidase II [Candidatus Peregrinibacteria bacterium]
MKKLLKYFIIFDIALVGIVIDFLIKRMAIQNLTDPIIFTDWLKLVFVKNFGIAFGLPFGGVWLILTNIVLLLALIIYFSYKLNLNKPLTQIIIGLLIAGALGNLIDRLIYGYVVDYISIGWWPVFNLADAFITLSVFLIIVFYDKMKETN